MRKSNLESRIHFLKTLLIYFHLDPVTNSPRKCIFLLIKHEKSFSHFNITSKFPILQFFPPGLIWANKAAPQSPGIGCLCAARPSYWSITAGNDLGQSSPWTFELCPQRVLLIDSFFKVLDITASFKEFRKFIFFVEY